jgi:hypothetical protein
MKIKPKGQCKICLEKDVIFSEDHVPPRSVQPFLNLKLFNPLGIRTDNFIPKTYYSQNGLKFNTICKGCNEKLQKYDASLRYFVHDLKKFLVSKLYVPRTIELICRPNAICRSVLGHLLSSKTFVDECPEDVKFRKCVLNTSSPIPDETFIHYWVYPFRSIKVFRDYAMPKKRGRFNDIPGVFHGIKFYPIAFLVTDFDYYEGLLSMNKYKTIPFSEEAKVEIALDKKYPEHWPETVDKGNFILMGKSLEDSRMAVQKR